MTVRPDEVHLRIFRGGDRIGGASAGLQGEQQADQHSIAHD
jgi:hypothetical protein